MRQHSKTGNRKIMAQKWNAARCKYTHRVVDWSLNYEINVCAFFSIRMDRYLYECNKKKPALRVCWFGIDCCRFYFSVFCSRHLMTKMLSILVFHMMCTKRYTFKFVVFTSITQAWYTHRRIHNMEYTAEKRHQQDVMVRFVRTAQYSTAHSFIYHCGQIAERMATNLNIPIIIDIRYALIALLGKSSPFCSCIIFIQGVFFRLIRVLVSSIPWFHFDDIWFQFIASCFLQKVNFSICILIHIY